MVHVQVELPTLYVEICTFSPGAINTTPLNPPGLASETSKEIKPPYKETSFIEIYHMSLRALSLSGRASYHKISWSLEALWLDVIIKITLCNLTGISAALLPRCLPNLRAIGKVKPRISRLQELTRFCDKTSVRLVNRLWNIISLLGDW